MLVECEFELSKIDRVLAGAVAVGRPRASIFWSWRSPSTRPAARTTCRSRSDRDELKAWRLSTHQTDELSGG